MALQLTWTSVASAIAGALALAFLGQVIYNLYFHPLRRFPGPLLHRATRVAFVHRLVRGTLPKDVLALHNRYGPVVRIAPNELAFLHPDAWKDIYGHRTGSLLGAEEMGKYDIFYRTKGIPPSVIAESRENHALLRKQLSHGFSDRSMREQEPIITSYVDLLIQRLREHCFEETYSDEKVTTKPKALDLRTWYNWTTFDIIGDLAFGEPFGCLREINYHPWVGTIANTIRSGAFFQAVKYLRLDWILLPVLKLVIRSRKEHQQMMTAMLKRRMEVKGERHDLIEGLLKKKEDWNLDFMRLRVNSGVLVIAGSETTATLLAGVTFLLLTNPAALQKLKDEVRSSFKTDEEITLTSVGNLQFMLACLNEALRQYPPVPIGMPRVVPQGGANIAGTFIPEKTVVACWQWAMNHSAANFVDPFAYKPERFLEESRNPHDRLDAVQPFSVGPRNCIGRNLAYAEMRLILAKILFNFDMELDPACSDWIDQKVFVLWAKKELNVYLKPAR